MFAMFGLGIPEMLIVGGIGVLLFGKRLPEVGRSLGKGLVEFKRGVQGIESDLDASVQSTPSRSYDDVSDHHEATAPKFEPPKSEPQDSSVPAEPSA